MSILTLINKIKSQKAKLTILITNITLGGYSGTETAVRDLAIGLKRLGHTPIVYSPITDGCSREILFLNIPVIKDLSIISQTPDIIHGHHHIETLEAISYFPTVPVIFFCHDHTAWHDIPIKHDNIFKYVAVDQYCFNRLEFDYQIPADNIMLIPNPVDTQRFKQRQDLPEVPKTALIFSNYTRKNASFLSTIRSACEALCIKLDVLDFFIEGSTKPETIIGNYDIVFAKGRCALEAAAVGCSVISIGTTGFGEIITQGNVRDLRRWSFIKHINQYPICESLIINEIKKYNPRDVKKVAKFIRNKANLTKTLNNYLHLYYQAIKTMNLIHVSNHGNLNLIKEKLIEKNNIELKRIYLKPLPRNIGAKLKLNGHEIPENVIFDSDFIVEIQLENYSDYIIGNLFPCPVQFSYYWVYHGKLKQIKSEVLNVPMETQALKNTTTSYCLNIKAPKKIGLHKLIISMEQITVQSFDKMSALVKLERTININNSDIDSLKIKK